MKREIKYASAMAAPPIPSDNKAVRFSKSNMMTRMFRG